MKTPRAFAKGVAKKRTQQSALGKPLIIQGAPKLSDYTKLSPLKIGDTKPKKKPR